MVVSNLTLEVENESSLNLDTIYHPQLAHAYNISLIVSFIITTLAIIPSIYIILTQSKKAKIFKYILINQLVWSYLFCAIYVAEGNVPLFPIPAVYFVGIFKAFSPQYLSVIVPVHLLISLGHTQSYFLACLYRVSYASAFSKFQRWFEDPRRLEALMIGLLLVFSGIIVGPFIFTKYDATVLREGLLNDHPVLSQLLAYEPSIISAPLMNLPTNSTSLTIALKTYSIYIPFTFLAGFGIFLIFLKQALNPSNFLSPTTRKNCLIVVHAKAVQITSAACFLLIPYLIQFIVSISKMKSGSMIALAAHFAPSYHLIFELIALFYFVKPYREYWIRVIGKITRTPLIRKLTMKTKSSGPSTEVTVPSDIKF